MNTNYKRGQELWAVIKWPVTTDIIVDAETSKAKAVRIVSADGNIVATVPNMQEAIGISQLLNFMQEFGDNTELQLREQRIYCNELAEYKKKYFELTLKYEEAMKQLYPLKAIDNRRDEESPARQMVETTGTEQYTVTANYPEEVRNT